MDHTPVLASACPLFRDVHHGQIQHFQQAVIRGEHGFAERFSHMKKGAVLINVGRGSAVNTEALCDALESGRLGGAALDVTDPEPLPPNHRLWRQSNALITPHVSVGYTLLETYERIIKICLENLFRFSKSEELYNQVDFKTGYRVSQK